MQVSHSAVGLALTLLASACFVDTGDGTPIVVSSTGTIIVDWTINGRKDPNDCAQLAADTIRVTVLFPDGAVLGQFAGFCESFATSISLDPGNYAADALFVDLGGVPRSTTLQIAPFTLFGGDRLAIPIDFPFNSFF